MKWFYNLRIRTKLILSFVFMAVIAAVIGYIGYSGMGSIMKNADEMYSDELIAIRDLGYANAALLTARTEVRNLLMTKDLTEREKYKKIIMEETKKVDDLIDKYSRSNLSKEDKEMLSKFQTTWIRYKELRDKAIDLAMRMKDEDALKIIDTDARESQSEARNNLRQLIDLCSRSADELGIKEDDSAAYAEKLLLIFIIFGIIIALSFGIFLASILCKPLNRGVLMLHELSKGHLGDRLRMDIKDEVGILAQTMDNFADDLQNIVVKTMQRISEGDVSMEITPKDAKDEITPALKMIIDSIRGLVAEAGVLTKAAIEGKLSTRGNADKFKGGYKEIVSGVNATLDAVIGPLNVAAEYVDRISKGDIPKRITDSYNGDFNEIKNNLNTCIDAVNYLTSDAMMLSKAAVEGKLSTRADASKHQGDFRRIVEGVNATLDAVIGPLNVAAEYVDRISKGDIPKKITDSYNGDFNEIKNNLNNCIDNINVLLNEAKFLETTAIEGKLRSRAVVEKVQGDYRNLLEGINRTLDYIVNHIDEIPSPTMIIDTDFNIRYINNIGAQVGGKNSQELIGTKCYNHFRTEDCPSGDCAMARAMKRGDKFSAETIARPGNLVLDIQYSAAPIKDKNGKVIGALEVVTDQTQVKNAQRLAKRISDYQEKEVNKLTESLGKMEQGYIDINLKISETDSDTLDTGKTFEKIFQSLNKSIETQYKIVHSLLGQIKEMTNSSNGLLQLSDQLATYSTELSAQTSTSASSSEQVSSNVSTVSSSAEEMAASIKEIAKNTELAAKLAKESQENANAASEVMNKLGESSQEIGNIVKTITSIAEQTNLLALNATIEAARAGESGKGFAVVANEVKELAKESAKATEDITNRIKTVQEETTRAIGVIDGIIGNIKKINDVSNTIASAVEEQSVTTSEVNRNLSEASRGVNSIVEVNTGISSSVNEYSKMASTLKNAANDLKGMAKILEDMLIKNYKL
jgi:methyl-accepting chemotaxis protein